MIGIDVNKTYCLLSNGLLFSLFLTFVIVECHIGQPCNSILGVCLPVSSHIYCDENNTCRCKKEYPIAVGPHTCLSPKHISDRCSHPEECHFTDKNSHCNQSPYSSRCECNSGFVFDKSQRKCVTEIKNLRKPSNTALMIPTAAGFLMACFSLLCCCALIWHNLCRKQDIIVRNGRNQPSDRTRNRRNQRETGRVSNGHTNRRNGIESGLSENQTTGHLPPYESILIDTMNNDPPPTYEEAIKDTQPSQLMASSSEQNAETKIT